MNINHVFDVSLAVEVGVYPAIIYSNIKYWCEKNRANEKNFFDGQYWTYNSKNAMMQLFPYMSYSQIKNALNTLVEKGYIGKGSYNQNPYDRTNWYCDLGVKTSIQANQSTGLKKPIDWSEKTNGLVSGDHSITNINTDINTDNKHLNIINEQSSLFEFDNSKSDNVGQESNDKKEQTLYQKMVEYWLKVFHPDWSFGATDGKKIKSLIKKLQKSLSATKQDYTDQDVLDLFKAFCSKLPDFYKSQTLSVLDSKYDSIVDEIKKGNGKSINTSNQHQRATAFNTIMSAIPDVRK